MSIAQEYEQAKKDHAYLWKTYGKAADMTGGYVDQDDLKKLLDTPTKKTALECLRSQIIYFVQVGPQDVKNEEWRDDPHVHEIADRYAALDDLKSWTSLELRDGANDE